MTTLYVGVDSCSKINGSESIGQWGSWYDKWGNPRIAIIPNFLLWNFSPKLIPSMRGLNCKFRNWNFPHMNLSVPPQWPYTHCTRQNKWSSWVVWDLKMGPLVIKLQRYMYRIIKYDFWSLHNSLKFYFYFYFF